MNFSFSATYLGLWAVVTFEGLLVLAVLQQLAKLRQVIEQGNFGPKDRLPIGSIAPEFTETDRDSGAQIGIQHLYGRGGLILFLSPDCSTCKALVDSLGRVLKDELPYTLAFCVGGGQSCARLLARLGSGVHPILENAAETAARYRISGFPTAIAVDGKRKIRGYGHPSDVEGLKRFFTRTLSADIDETAAQPELSSTLSH